MNFIKLFFVLVTISFGTTLFGQLKETVHQTFEIEDAQSINLDLAGDYEIVKWAGNTLMSKTYIELSDARPSILNFYLKDGRYELEGTTSSIFKNSFSNITDNFWKFIRTNMRMGIHQNIFCSSMFYQQTQSFFNITTFMRSSIEFTIRISPRTTLSITCLLYTSDAADE